MSRYYDIQLFAPGNKSNTPTRSFNSFPNGTNDPGALNVVLDAYVYSFEAADQQTVVQIWGISLQDLMQAQNFTNWTIKIYGGFQAGLPLNNPAQAGLLVEGLVFQSFGNWFGTDMSLDFIVAVTGALASAEANISFDWKAGVPLATALATTLSTAFPGVKQTIQISPQLVLNHDAPGYYQSLTQFNQMLKPLSQSIIGSSTYLGVSISMGPTGLLIQDGTITATPTQILFQELIGQPTWQIQNVITFICPMRADLHVGSAIKLPKGLTSSGGQGFGAPGAVTTTAASLPQSRQSITFSGVFVINSVHHMGEFRNPTGDAWISVFTAYGQIAA